MSITEEFDFPSDIQDVNSLHDKHTCHIEWDTKRVAFELKSRNVSETVMQGAQSSMKNLMDRVRKFVLHEGEYDVDEVIAALTEAAEQKRVLEAEQIKENQAGQREQNEGIQFDDGVW